MSGPPAVALTGVGFLTPLGDNLADVARALGEGRSSVSRQDKPVAHAASRLVDFEATRYANVRGMRIYNHTTRLGICATRLALNDAGLGEGVPPEELGVVMASTYGHLDTLVEYDRSLVENGPARTNPALMPLAIPSAPGAVIALSFAAKACSITLADGGAGGLDALGLGARLVRSGRAGVCVVVSAFAPFDELVLSLARSGALSSDGESRAFERTSRGYALGEGAVALVLESAERAARRQRSPLGYVTGQAGRFAPTADRLSDALARAAKAALVQAEIAPDGLGLVASGASGIQAQDAAEASAIRATLGKASVPVTAIKHALGETFDTSGLFAAASALATLGGSPLPPLPALQSPVEAGLRFATSGEAVVGDHALITATSRTGAGAAAVISRKAPSHG